MSDVAGLDMPMSVDEVMDSLTVDDYLHKVSYGVDTGYVPSAFALEFVTFIKLVNGVEGEENLTPLVHYHMLDTLTENGARVANLCHRGIAKALSLDTRIPTPEGWKLMRDICPGDWVYGEDGKATRVMATSEIFNKPMYRLVLGDGRELKVSEDHINTVIHRRQKRVDGRRVNYLDRRDLTTQELLEIPLTASRGKTTKNPKGRENKVWLPLPKPVEYPVRPLPIEPYTLGLACHGNDKFVPVEYKLASVEQRLAVLQGLMDTDGTSYEAGCCAFSSNSRRLADDVQELVFSLGGSAMVVPMKEAYRVDIRLNLPLFRLPRKRDRQHMKCLDRVPLVAIEPIAQEPSKCLAVESSEHTFLAGEYVVTHNTTLMGEYLFLYLGTYGAIPGFGKISLALYVSDSIENGVKNMRKNLEFRWQNSEFLQEYAPNVRFTDVRWEFENLDGNIFVVKGYGAKALSLDSLLYTVAGTTTIGECQVGDEIFGPDGQLTRITRKSEIFNKPMYRIGLQDGRSIKVSEDHINSVVINTNPNNTVRWEALDLTTKELLQQPLLHTKKGNLKHRGTSSKSLVFVKNTAPLDYPEQSLPIDPYTLGLNVHGNEKFIPEVYFYGSVEQRLALLQGLMDTNGTITKTGRTSFCSVSPQLLADVIRLARSLGATASTNKKPFNAEIWLNKPLFRLPRKLNRQRYDRKDSLVAVTSIERIADEPSQCIAVDNVERQFLADNYFRTHNTGVRGAKELGTRPQLAVLDDLISDEDARSATVIASVEDTVYKAVDYALHPKKNMIIWSGTPFNAKDPLYKAVESGAWAVNVFPVCEEFPCSREDFRGSWPERFDFDYVVKQYESAMKAGKIDTFNQELMLKIMSDEDRLIQDHDIAWYKIDAVLRNKNRFNFYITTDFATSARQSGDFSVISVWAYNNVGDWLWVDGIVKRQTMGKNLNDLFRLAQMYRPQSVGIEVSGQQEGFIDWIQNEMMNRNIFFPLASMGNANKPGIRPSTNKLVRFNVMVPMFQSRKMFFPVEKKNTPELLEAYNELSLASPGGFRSKHDDFIDTISMLALLTPWKPSEDLEMRETSGGMWEMDDHDTEIDRIGSYIV